MKTRILTMLALIVGVIFVSGLGGRIG